MPLPYSINSLDVDNINPIIAVYNAISKEGIPASVEPRYGAVK